MAITSGTLCDRLQHATRSHSSSSVRSRKTSAGLAKTDVYDGLHQGTSTTRKRYNTYNPPTLNGNGSNPYQTLDSR
ncbi:hypothetical protein NIES4074_36650 [Cylindrospermum sp. NIES-4074]|nr:hypothetical protein NIES4074_36650 [Cylindrospermum sp. NIES-4074]